MNKDEIRGFEALFKEIEEEFEILSGKVRTDKNIILEDFCQVLSTLKTSVLLTEEEIGKLRAGFSIANELCQSFHYEQEKSELDSRWEYSICLHGGNGSSMVLELSFSPFYVLEFALDKAGRFYQCGLSSASDSFQPMIFNLRTEAGIIETLSHDLDGFQRQINQAFLPGLNWTTTPVIDPPGGAYNERLPVFVTRLLNLLVSIKNTPLESSNNGEDQDAEPEDLPPEPVNLQPAEDGMQSHKNVQKPAQKLLKCPSCKTNPKNPDARYCRECGAVLIEVGENHCLVCDKLLSPDARFCGQCGTEA